MDGNREKRVAKERLKIHKEGRCVISVHNWICLHICRQLILSLYVDVWVNANTPTDAFQIL